MNRQYILFVVYKGDLGDRVPLAQGIVSEVLDLHVLQS